MPLSKLTDEQVLELLKSRPAMLSVPGVALVGVEFSDAEMTELAVVASVYPGEDRGIALLPVSVGGLPVIVKIEDRRSRQVLQIIDPRKNGGAWPTNGHDD